MADFSSLKQTIQTYIKQNGNEEITGNILQNVLLAMVSTMGDSAINGLVSALQDEITARQNQDGTLQGNITAETTARRDADTALGGRIDVLQTAINGINTKLAEGYLYAGIASPSTNPENPSGKVFYIAIQAGTYTNFGGTVVAYGINILKYNGSTWSLDQIIAIDARPKKASQNLVASGGVFDNIGALDVSELNATENPHTLAQYADLSSALAAIPTDYQKGGMSIKFIQGTVQSSDNKYVQYRFMLSGSFTSAQFTNPDNWQGVDDEPTAGSKNLVKSGGVAALTNITTVTGRSNGKAWVFDYKLTEGEKYYFKFVSGYGLAENKPLIIGSNTILSLIVQNQWVEFTSTSTGVPAFYFGSASAGEQPIVQFAEGENISVDLLMAYDSKAGIEEIAGRNTGTSWVFEYEFKEGEKYYVKHISGLGDKNEKYIAVGSSSITRLYTGTWVELTSPATGKPYIYFGNNDPGVQPILRFATAENTILREIKDIDNDINSRTVAKSLNGTESPLHNSWGFDYPMIAGQKYFVKHVSGNGNGKSLAIGHTNPLIYMKTGRWIEYTAPESGNPFLYTGSSLGVQPTIEFMPYDAAVPMKDFTTYEPEGIVWNTINVSRDGTSKTERTIHFSGLNAIADAIDSITDASETNRYIIHVEGLFHFTDPLTLTMSGGGEYSAIFMKEFVDIEGDGPDKSIVFVDFPANATFHTDKHYNDYQPIYFYGVGGTVRNMKFVGKNCRYAFHIEKSSDGNNNDYTINIEDCTIVSYGAPDYTASGEMTCMGTGIGDGQVWNIKNCDMLNYSGHAFAMHTPTTKFKRSPAANVINCRFMGSISFGNFQLENTSFLNIVDCTFAKGGEIPTLFYNYNNGRYASIHGNYTTLLTSANKLNAVFLTNGLQLNDGHGVGQVLMIESLSSGNNSKVRFLPNGSSAYSIVGDPQEDAKLQTSYGWDTQYGYVYRDGGTDLNGKAFGTIDVDEHSDAGKTLGVLLGDCSTTNKTLIIQIDGTSYTVVFNEDYSDKTNEYVIGKINDAIGTAGEASLFCPTCLYYPSINSLSNAKSVDNGAILKGMGVVFDNGGMRRARNSDGYIDGICLDDTSLGQYGRVILSGYIAHSAGYFNQWFILCTDSAAQGNGSKYGIDANEDGKFVYNASPSLLRVYANDKEGYPSALEIL